jgi:S-adenosyl-L-methionine hydrolase (adenosine-forming)
MILFFTDFGTDGPYIGQMTAKLRENDYSGDIINLFSDAPVYSVQASSVLLSAYSSDFGPGSVFVCVVDPGVGSARKALAISSKGLWFVGPDNGLFEGILRRDPMAKINEIIWNPERLSASFQGRDLFAPVAAKIVQGHLSGTLVPISIEDIVRQKWADQLAEIIYVDHYGNAVTGILADLSIQQIEVSGKKVPIIRTFSDVDVGKPLAYENANGLLEIAVNQGRADDYFDLRVGSRVTIIG